MKHLFPVKIFIVILIIMLMSACESGQSDPYPVESSEIFEQAAVVSAHSLASQIGVDILKAGGNAVDAAVASQFALAVVYPRAGNIGGGGFMLIRTSDGTLEALDYREKAPASAQSDMYLDEHKEVIDSLSRYGSLSSGVPGTVAGLLAAWRKYGKIKDLALLLNPAIQLADEGYILNQDEVGRLNYYREDFLKFNKHDIPFVKEANWEPGDKLIQKELAQTLKEIVLKKEAGFYDSRVAEKIDSQMRADGGRITLEDLSAYKAIWRNPVSASYKEYQIHSMSPPSSGGIALAQLVKMVEPYDLQKMGFQSSESIHLMAECERRVYADRAFHLGDSDFYDVPVAQLLDDDYINLRMLDFNKDFASSSNAFLPNISIQMESFETTHTSIVDQEGMAVSVTTTLNSNFGSKVWVKDAGFFLNNEMDDFSVKPGVANQFGLVGGRANAIEGGKRMLSSMTPTIVEKEGELFMVLGSPGGSTIITSVFQVFLNVVEFEMNMTEAVRAPRFHHQCLPDRIFIEKGKMAPLTMDSLKKKGHKFDEYDKIGLVKAILVRDDGSLEAVGDTRSFDDVEGF